MIHVDIFSHFFHRVGRTDGGTTGQHAFQSGHKLVQSFRKQLQRLDVQKRVRPALSLPTIFTSNTLTRRHYGTLFAGGAHVQESEY